MNALAPIVLSERQRRDDGATLLAAWQPAAGALLLLGRAPASLPGQGSLQFERRAADRGPFRCLSWPEPHGVGFCLAVRLPATTPVQPGRRLGLLLAEADDAALHLPERFLAAAEFADAAATLAGEAGGALARFFADALPAAALRQAPQAGAMLAAYAARVATADGAIEMMGAIADGCAFLQGWGTPVAEGAEILLAGPRFGRFPVHFARFGRPDIIAPATGMLLVLPAEAEPALDMLEHAYLLSGARLLRLSVFQRRRLSAEDSAGHLRALLPSLRCAPKAADCLRAALRPRYDGRDTLGSVPGLHAALDLAVAGPGGAYLAGWLVDTGGRVAQVSLCSGGDAVRIDTAWTRVPRPDVRDSFAAVLPAHADPLLGFSAFAAGLSGADLHLDCALADGNHVFLPVAAVASTHPAAERLLLGSVDLHKPSGLAVVERHLAPAVRAFAATTERTPVGLRGTAGMTEAACAIVVPLTDAPVLPRACLSQFLHDPLRPGEALMLVCGAAWDEAAVGRLRAVLEFAGLDATVLPTDATDPCAAVDAAVAASRSAHLLLLSPEATSANPGWRATLAEAAARRPDACACPVLLHEDRSIRFAGIGAIRTLTQPPYAQPERELAGLPGEFLPGGPPRETLQGTLACCLLPRAALASIGGARQGGLAPVGREAALFRRLRAAGHPCLLVPQATVFAPETADGASRAARLVDGWIMRADALAGDAS